MKKLILLIALFPMLSFAQDNKESQRKGIRDSSVIKEVVKPAYFVDGKEVENNILSKLNPDEIKSITVIKNDPKYPQGKIEVYMK
jgi:hypothetical protein